MTGPMKVAAYLRLAQLQGWDDEERRADDKTEDEAFSDWARLHAIHIRRSLIEAAEPAQIADALAALCDVLDQTVRTATADFIVDMVGKVGAPVYVLNALFARVATTEAGKIKPASFGKVLQGVEPRLRRVRRAAADAVAFVRDLEDGLAALASISEHPTTVPIGRRRIAK
jgi:hypothetical protein